jgi:hypothetical protein
MTQKRVIFYNDEGKITGRRSGVAENVDIDIAKASFSHIDVTSYDYEISGETHYVKDGAIQPKGDKPAEGYEFNYASGAWELDLTLARDVKWEAIKAARDAQEFSQFDWGGYTFQCDEVSQRRIQGAVQLAAIDDTMTLDWTLADNSVQTFTASEYVQIGQSLAIHVGQCHERGRILRQEIESATTEAELEAIVW